MPKSTESPSGGYRDPRRTPEDIVRAAFGNPALMRELVLSYEEELRGIPPVPLRQVQEEARARNAVRARRRHTA